MKYVLKKAIVGILAMSVAFSALPYSSVDAAKNQKKVVLSKKKLTVKKGKRITVTLKYAKAKVKWSVKNKKIVKITKKKGTYKNKITVLGKKVGKTKITAKYKGKKYNCTITVKKIKKTSPTVVETNTEQVTSQESTSEAVTSSTYPGQDEGWSPIVTPDDLKKYEDSLTTSQSEESTSSQSESITTSQSEEESTDYIGQKEGWSPIVTPGDLNKN